MEKKQKRILCLILIPVLSLALLAGAAAFLYYYPLITLKGDSAVTIELGQSYEDAGASHLLGLKLDSEGEVNNQKPGTYTITYSSLLHTVFRTVTVVDVTAPTVTLNGDSYIVIPKNGTYTEAGITAVDDCDGDISQNLTIEGTVDPAICGHYILHYSATDSSGNTSAVLSREVFVDGDFATITNPALLSEKVQEGILNIVNDYAYCLKYLKHTEDDTLMVGGSQFYLYQGLTNMTVDMHKEMPLDLSIQSIVCSLDIIGANNDGTHTTVFVTETDTIVYNYNPNNACISRYSCTFVFNAAEELVDIQRVEGCFYALHKDYSTQENYASYIDAILTGYHNKWTSNRQTAIEALNQLNNGTITYQSICTQTATHPYDRVKAVAYAEQYALVTNPAFYYFANGNCVNFASQCLYAGGLPMVNDGTWTWKYYSLVYNGGDGAYGYTYSWVGTGPFVRFAKYSNVDIFQPHLSPFLSEPGDVIMWGDGEGDYGHATVCSGVIKDASGKVVDVLFCGNTNHVLNASVMASTSLYCECEKVIGYN